MKKVILQKTGQKSVSEVLFHNLNFDRQANGEAIALPAHPGYATA